MRPRSYLVAMMIAALVLQPVFANDYVVVVKNGVSKLYEVDAEANLVPIGDVRVLNLDGDLPVNPTNPDKPVPDLSKFVTKQLESVPKSNKKADAQDALAAAYKALAEQWRTGKFKSASEFLGVRSQTHNTVTTALGVRKDWAEFDAKLVAELNRLRLRTADIEQAMLSISQGLSEGKALNPELLATMVQLVLAVISKDPSAIADAVTKLVGIITKNRK